MPDIVRPVDFSAQRIKEASAGMWQDFYNDLRPFSRVSGYSNDFHAWVPDEWTSTEVGTSLQDIEDIRNGVLRLTSGGTENNGNNLQLGGTGDTETTGEQFAPAAGKNLWFEARIKGNDVDQNDTFIGLHVEDTSIVARGSDYIGFTSVDASAALNVQSASGSVLSTELGVHTMVDATWVIIGFKVTSTNKVEFYVNNVLKATISTNIPTALMKLSISSITGEGSANELDIDYVACYQDR